MEADWILLRGGWALRRGRPAFALDVRKWVDIQRRITGLLPGALICRRDRYGRKAHFN